MNVICAYNVERRLLGEIELPHVAMEIFRRLRRPKDLPLKVPDTLSLAASLLISLRIELPEAFRGIRFMDPKHALELLLMRTLPCEATNEEISTSLSERGGILRLVHVVGGTVKNAAIRVEIECDAKTYGPALQALSALAAFGLDVAKDVLLIGVLQQREKELKEAVTT